MYIIATCIFPAATRLFLVLELVAFEVLSLLHSGSSGGAREVRGGAVAPGGHLQVRHFEPLTINGEHMYNAIITKIALTRSTLSAQNSLNVV